LLEDRLWWLSMVDGLPFWWKQEVGLMRHIGLLLQHRLFLLFSDMIPSDLFIFLNHM
jgi:hypothetical protein